jgi:hypothetical protein
MVPAQTTLYPELTTLPTYYAFLENMSIRIGQVPECVSCEQEGQKRFLSTGKFQRASIVATHQS